MIDMVEEREDHKTIPVADQSELEKQQIVERLRGSVLKDDDPFGPAAPLEDWEALRY